jgi:hypothetical protein
MKMEFPKLKETQARLDAKRAELAAIFAEAGTEYDMDKVKSLSGDSKAKVEEIRKRNTEIDEIKAELDGLLQIRKAAELAAEGGENGESEEEQPKSRKPYKSIGELFAASEAYKGYRSGAGIGPVATLDIGLSELFRPQATLFETAAGWDPQDLRSGLVTLKPLRPAPHVVDSIPEIPTTQSAYVFMEETTATLAAAEKAEGIAYPEAAFALTQRTKPVQKVAVFLPVTDEQLEDEPGARAYVNQRLVYALQNRLDAQVLVGDGVAPNLEGTENVVGIQTQALGTDPIPDAIYKAARKVRDDGFAEPSVVFIAPSKWENVRLLRTADGIYIWGHPSTPGPFSIWGIPIVETTAVTSTKAVLGDYTIHAFLAVKRGVDVQVSNSHSTFFTEGKLAVRADVRVAMVHVRPKAFATVTGL